ncbi:MAG: RNase P modulator RnpM [Candidatus Limnocylindria bacterium]
MGAKGAQPRPLPQRTCVACRTERAKRELLRVVRGEDGTLSVDARGKAPGRGAYLCSDPACIGRGLRDGAVSRALEVPVGAADADRLAAQLEAAGRARQKGGR